MLRFRFLPNKKDSFKIFIAAGMLLANGFQLIAQDNNALYPVGKKFPLGLYAFQTDDIGAPADGWDAAHNYLEAPMSDSTLNVYKNLGMMGFARLSNTADSSKDKVGKPESVIASEIQQQAANGNICWFDLPEECRYWKTSEMDIVKNYSTWTRKYDHGKHPNYMYIPGNYDKTDIENYVDYLDIIPASCYPIDMGKPHTYVRYQTERTFFAIAARSKTIGKNYLNGEKTVMSILELFGNGNGMSAAGSRHDFWLSLAAGARGVLVYAHYYRDSNSVLKSCWAALTLSARQFTSAKLGEPLLFGTSYNVGMSIKAGPATAVYDSTVSYPSITFIAKTYADTLYMIAVNSNESANIVTAEFSGLPDAALQQGKVLFENRVVHLSNTMFTDSFKPLEVHVYKFALQSATNVANLSDSKNEFNIYPNPFNPTTTISFELQQAGNVTLVVYDYLGREISTLINEYKSAGKYNVKFNANNLASGVYFCRLTAGKFISVKKMILAK